MALDPNAFGPDAGNESTQESSRKRRVSALMGGRPSLGSLYSGDDSSDGLSKSPLNEGDTSSSLATPNLSGAAPGAPSLLSSERVGRAPSQYSAMPVLGAADRADAAFGEAERGEEGVLGGGTKPGLSTGDRNRALMSFFHPQRTAQQGAVGPSDAQKAVSAGMKAENVAGKAKKLFGVSMDSVPAIPHFTTPYGDVPYGSSQAPDFTPADMTPAPDYTPVPDNVGETAGSSVNFKAPNFGSAGTYGTGLGAAGSLMSLIAAIKQDEDLKTAGQATSAAGSAVNAGNTLASGGNVSGGSSGALAAGTRLGTGAYGISQMEGASDQQKALQALHEASMAVADWYSGGLAELGPLIGSHLPKDGVEGWIGASMLGGPGLANYSDESVQTLKRNAAQRMADKETASLRDLYSKMPQGNMGATYAALRAKLDPRGAVRSNLDPATAKQLGLTSGEWGDMSPEQFQSVMDYLKADPSRLSAVRGSGDVGYLPQYEAEQTALQSANAARSLLARQLGIQYTPEETDQQIAMREIQDGYTKYHTPSLRNLFDAGPAGGN